MVRTHSLKLNVKDYDLVEKRVRNIDVRLNDRNYCVGDWLVMHEWTGREYTGRWLTRSIEHILPLDEFGFVDWIVMQIR